MAFKKMWRPNAKALGGVLPEGARVEKIEDKEERRKAKKKARRVLNLLTSHAVVSEILHESRPAVPLPVALIADMKLHGALTATDEAALALMLACVREDPALPERLLPAAGLADALHISKRKRLDEVVKRLNAAKVSFDFYGIDRREKADRIPLMTITSIVRASGKEGYCVSFSPQIMRVLRLALPFVFVEIAATASFKSRWSARIYGQVLRRVWEENLTAAGGEVSFSIAPRDLAEAMGWEMDGFGFADFRRIALEPALKDLKGLTRLGVSMDMRRDEYARGRPVEALDFIVDVRPADMASVGTLLVPERDFDKLMDRRSADAAHLRISAKVVLKAAKTFFEAPPPHLRYVEYGKIIDTLESAWDIALARALSGEEVAVRGRIRGRQLLEEIEAEGATNAAWRFFQEEAVGPDVFYDADPELGHQEERQRAAQAREERGGTKRRGIPLSPIARLCAPTAATTGEARVESETEELEVEVTPPSPPASFLTLVLASGFGPGNISAALTPFRAPADAEKTVQASVAWICGNGTYSCASHGPPLRAGCADEIAALECVEEVLPLPECEARPILRERDAAVARPSQNDLCIVLDSRASVPRVYEALKPSTARHDEYGLRLCVAIPRAEGWDVVEPSTNGIRPGSEPGLTEIPGVIDVLNYRAEAARLIMSSRPLPTPEEVEAERLKVEAKAQAEAEAKAAAEAEAQAAKPYEERRKEWLRRFARLGWRAGPEPKPDDVAEDAAA